jgi:hypothetical protein
MVRGRSYCFAACLVLMSGVAIADARDEVIAAMDAVVARPSYRATTMTTIRGPETTVINATIDFIAPSRFRIELDKEEVLVLPGGNWRRSEGRWIPFNEDMSEMVANYSPDAMRRSYERIRNVRRVGTETIEGCDATHFVYDAALGEPDRPMVVSADLWVCDRTGLPIRVSTGDPGGTVTAVVTYDFDTEISIPTPK